MIPAGVKVYLASHPIDFRKGSRPCPPAEPVRASG
jgi:hypothetical protein